MTRVLIVDDNAENLYMLRALLQASGYQVEEARDGAEALNKARQNPPDLVISDLLMPVLDGYMLLRYWRADERLKEIPFIVYTATYTEPRDERLAMALGADEFMIKPAEPDPFLACVQLVLSPEHRAKTRMGERRLEDAVLLLEYSDVLVRKLEKKAQQLEQSNRELLAEIIEKKAAEKTLQMRDRAIQAVSQGILITDPRQPDCPVVYASAGVEGITGYRPDEFVGRNCRFLQGKDTNPETVLKLRTAIAAGQPCQVDILNYRKNGTAFWNALSLDPVHDESGGLSYFVGIQTDVTDRKRLEEQLRQSQKMEAVGRLAGGVAHDFNNLLTIISGYSQIMLAMPSLPENIREPVEAISQAGDRAAALTRQLLGFSRQTILQPKVLDLNAVILETGKMLRRVIGEDVLFTTTLTPNLAAVKVDPSQVDQVLMNLAVNARDAMPQGGKLTVETANVQIEDDYAVTRLDWKPGKYVMLAVSDTGCGMTPEIKSRIFEPFFTTKEVGKGTGLGLPMVYGIVQQSGGFINVYSEPDHGTTFKIYFPAVSESVTAPSESHSTGEFHGTETILLVEDDEGVRGLALRSLRMHGYTVLTAIDGKVALQVVDSHKGPLDLVLSDVVMPNLGGPEMAKQLRSRFPDLKMLFMSGYTDDAVIRHGLLEAEVSFIQKPYTPTALARKVRQVLDGRAN